MSLVRLPPCSYLPALSDLCHGTCTIRLPGRPERVVSGRGGKANLPQTKIHKVFLLT